MSKPTYWQSLEQRDQTPEYLAEAGKEFANPLPVEEMLSEASEESMRFKTNRRDFLKALGFGITATTLSGCLEAPTKKAIPYVVKPDNIIPGVANYYASTSPSGTPILVKTRVGRPIKLEGNPDSYISKGGLDAAGHGSLLNLYDLDRLQSATKGGNPVEWSSADAEIMGKLQSIQANGGKVRVLSHTVMSPTAQKVIDNFLAAYTDAKHVQYDAVSVSSILDAHEANFGTRALPTYDFSKADVIASFACDFLGTWISPTEFTWQYASNRDANTGKMSRHFQFESMMSLTGSNADLRFPIKPSQTGLALLSLYNKVSRLLGKPTLPNVPAFNVAMNGLDKVANELVGAQGRSLVVCGTNDTGCQQLVNALNHMLGNYGKTLDINDSSNYRKGSDADLAELAGELERGEVDALILYDTNPVYNTAYSATFEKALASMTLSVALTPKANESTANCQYVCPTNHYLESWGDVQQAANRYSLIQPAINPIFSTRQAEESFLTWSGDKTVYREYLKAAWQEDMYDASKGSFQSFWDDCLRMGVYELPASEGNVPGLDDSGLMDLVGSLSAVDADLELVFYEKIGIRDGQASTNNPWLQELPDPVTRAVWDNYITVPNAYAEENGLKNFDVVRLEIPNKEPIEMGILIQPGQAAGTLGVAIGYGQKGGRVAEMVGGSNAYAYLDPSNSGTKYNLSGVSLTKTGQTYKIARTQTFDLLYDPAKGETLGNDYDRTEQIVRETILPHFAADKNADNPYRNTLKKWDSKRKHLVTLWESHFEDPETSKSIRWAMAIDMNKCTGCGACVVSCHTENNVPVVGKTEVLRRREMHWMRIDRYYAGSAENPDVVFQPMMCQHCDNAPCETVCPVLATIHSDEGLNQMAYNRCVGTRYCANNCPYKVRRFNWFNYTNGDQFKDINPSQSELGRLVLNPDVTVRFRGVMEKCSFCVQRLQEKKLKAKIQGDSSFAKPEDSRDFTACQSSCPTGAIVFGDLNDPNSAVSKLYYQESSFHVIEEVKTLPSVKYMTKVRNRTEEEYEIKEGERTSARTYS